MKKVVLIISFLVIVLFIGACSQQQNTSTGNQPSASTNGQSSTIVIKGFAFNPSTLTIKAGTTVTWINQDSMQHTIKSSTFNSGSLNNGESFSFKFDGKGSYEYICGLHPSMKGKIIVE